MVRLRSLAFSLSLPFDLQLPGLQRSSGLRDRCLIVNLVFLVAEGLESATFDFDLGVLDEAKAKAFLVVDSNSTQSQ